MRATIKLMRPSQPKPKRASKDSKAPNPHAADSGRRSYHVGRPRALRRGGCALVVHRQWVDHFPAAQAGAGPRTVPAPSAPAILWNHEALSDTLVSHMSSTSIRDLRNHFPKVRKLVETLGEVILTE